MNIPHLTLRKISIFAVMLISVILFTGCPDEGTNDPSKKDGDFELGESKEYSVSGKAGTEIADDISGCMILFPEGGNGTLTVSQIKSGPELEYEAVQFQIDYSGHEKVQLKVPLSENVAKYMFYYGVIENAAIHPELGNNGWWTGIERDTVDGGLLFDLNLNGSVTSRKEEEIKSYKPPPAKHFSIVAWDKNSTSWQAMIKHYHTIKEVAKIWTDNMSPALAQKCINLMNGDLTFDVRPSSKENYYQHLDNWLFGKNAVFCLTKNADLNAVSHETGHYMNHVLCGYDKYCEIYALMPKEYWGLGGSIDHTIGMFYPGRLYLLEDYAYYSQFLATGNLDLYDLYNIDKYNPYSIAIDKPRDPKAKDYPSHEGFGVFIIAGLMRAESQGKIKLFDLSGEVDVPAVNISAGDVIEHFLAPGPKNINELITLTNSYLMAHTQGGHDKFPAIAEPLGWSYHGSGTILNQDKEPFPGCKVYNVCLAGGKEFYTPEVYTDKDGNYTLERIFPGASALRICYNMHDGIYTDSIDYPLEVLWTQQTDHEIDLGEKTLYEEPPDILAMLQKSQWISINLSATNQYNAEVTFKKVLKGIRNSNPVDETKDEAESAYFGINFSHREYGSGPKLTWNDREFSVTYETEEFVDQFEIFEDWKFTVSGLVDDKGKIIQNLVFSFTRGYDHEYWEDPYNYKTSYSASRQYVFNNINVDDFSDGAHYFVRYRMEGLPQLKTSLSGFDYEYMNYWYQEDDNTKEVINDWRETCKSKSYNIDALTDIYLSIEFTKD